MGGTSSRVRSSGATTRTAPERDRPRPGPAREEALRILVRVSQEGAWASRLLEAMDGRALDARDIALAHEIVLGVLRWRGRLDASLGRLSRLPLESLDPTVREALRIGAYQILFLDRVPHHAAVNGSVELARRASGPGAAGLVNAILRKLAAEAERRPADSDDGIAAAAAPSGKRLVERLAGELSHPAWLVERILSRFDQQEARALLLANNEAAPVTLRVNPLHPAWSELAQRLAGEGVETAPGRYAPGALRVLAGRPVRTPAFDQGAFWIQDEASQLVPFLFPPPWDGLSADLCAAPGGKSFVLATGGRVAAFDLHPHRLLRMAPRARMIAPCRIAMAVADFAEAPPVCAAAFDRVLVDAPCSGTGVLRRHPEIRWRLGPQQIASLSALQSRLLDAGFRALRPGGLLVYSVCSIEPEEGDHVLDAFVERCGCKLVDPRPHLPEAARSLVGDDGRLRTFPHRHGTDGFFAALVQKPRSLP